MTKSEKRKKGLPKRILEIIESNDGIWTDHALENSFRLDLFWEDVIQLARTAGLIKKERDPSAVGGYKYSVTGRDTRGRPLYMAGKVVTYEQEAHWRVITLHEAD